MHNDVDTYFDFHIDSHLTNSLQSKKSWIIRWEHFIYARIKCAKQDSQQGNYWKSFNHNKVPQFFIQQNHAFKASRNKALRQRTLQESKLTLTEGYNICPAKRSTSKEPVPKQPPNYKDNMPSVQQYFKQKYIREK